MSKSLKEIPTMWSLYISTSKLNNIYVILFIVMEGIRYGNIEDLDDFTISTWYDDEVLMVTGNIDKMNRNRSFNVPFPVLK